MFNITISDYYGRNKENDIEFLSNIFNFSDKVSGHTNRLIVNDITNNKSYIFDNVTVVKVTGDHYYVFHGTDRETGILKTIFIHNEKDKKE